jgi:hypothetical protein
VKKKWRVKRSLFFNCWKFRTRWLGMRHRIMVSTTYAGRELIFIVDSESRNLTLDASCMHVLSYQRGCVDRWHGVVVVISARYRRWALLVLQLRRVKFAVCIQKAYRRCVPVCILECLQTLMTFLMRVHACRYRRRLIFWAKRTIKRAFMFHFSVLVGESIFLKCERTLLQYSWWLSALISSLSSMKIDCSYHPVKFRENTEQVRRKYEADTVKVLTR